MVVKKNYQNEMFMSENDLDDSIESYTIEPIPCITKLPLVGHETPFKFLIKSVKGEFIDPNHLELYLKFKIWTKDATGEKKALAAGEKVTPICGFFYTMFKDITVDFNGITVYTTHQQYQHLSYLSILLHAPHSMKRTVLESCLWKQDRAGAFDLVHMGNESLNPAAYWRGKRIEKSKPCEMKGQIQIDCLKVSKPILDGIDIGLTFYMHEPKSCLIANLENNENAPDYTIEIIEANLEVGRIRPKQTSVPRAVYPYVHREMLHMIHEKGLSYFGPVTIANGVLPQRVVVAITNETNFNGTLKENRLRLQHFGVDNIVVRINSIDKPFRGGYKMNYTANMYMDAYYGLFRELGQTSGNTEIGPIDFSDYDSGYTIYAFDTSPGHMASAIEYGKIGTGNCELMIHFKQTPLTDNVVVLVMMEFERKYTLSSMESSSIRQFRFESIAV